MSDPHSGTQRSAPNPSPSDVSVVVQGPVDVRTPDVLESVRSALPGSQVVLSTWEGQDTSGLPAVDHIVFSKDPGGSQIFTNSSGETSQNNVNRQILSTSAGIAATSGAYLLKLRSDTMLTGANGFLEVFGRFRCFDERYRHVRDRIICNASGARDPGLYGYCFHPGDFFFFGHRGDLEELFDVDFYTPKPFEEVMPLSRSERVLYLTRAKEAFAEYCPEVYLFRAFLLEKGAPVEEFSTYYEYSRAWCDLSQRYMVNQFVLLEDRQIGLQCSKYPDYEGWGYLESYDFESWGQLYRGSCSPTPEEVDFLRDLSARWRPRAGLTRHLKRLERKASLGSASAAFSLRLWLTLLRVPSELAGEDSSAFRLRRGVKKFVRRRRRLLRHEASSGRQSMGEDPPLGA